MNINKIGTKLIGCLYRNMIHFFFIIIIVSGLHMFVLRYFSVYKTNMYRMKSKEHKVCFSSKRKCKKINVTTYYR